VIPNARSAIAFGSAGNTLNVQLQRLGHARVVRHEIAPLAASDPHLALYLWHVICGHSAQQRLNVDRAVVRALDLNQSVPVHQAVRRAAGVQGVVGDEARLFDLNARVGLVRGTRCKFLLSAPEHGGSRELLDRAAGQALDDQVR
jgi:hypothetical protein